MSAAVSSAAEMAAMGLLTAVLAPTLVVLTRDSPLWRRLRLPSPLILTGFILLHATITIGMTFPLPMAAMAAGRLTLLAGATLFWLPLLGPECCRISAAARCAYLYIGAPSLDLAAVVVIAHGDDVGGLSMIAAMLPIGFTGMALTWQWVTSEERAARAAEQAELRGVDAAGTAQRVTAPAPQASGATVPLARTTVPGTPTAPGGPRGRVPRAGLGPQSRPALRAEARPAVTRRGLQIALGILWLSATVLQAQPTMFTPQFTRQVLLPAAAGQPIALAGLIRAMAALVAAHPVLANVCFVMAQALIGAGVLHARTTRPALLASIAWAAGVWVAGEGLGGLAAGMGGVLAGAPGAALLYGLIAAAAMPSPGDRGRGLPPPRWLPACWAGLWLVLLLAGPWPGQTPGGWRTLALSVGLALAKAIAALGVLGPGPARDTALAVGGALAIAATLAAGLGGIASGYATDVGVGPPLLLLAAAVWESQRSRITAAAARPALSRS